MKRIITPSLRPVLAGLITLLVVSGCVPMTGIGPQSTLLKTDQLLSNQADSKAPSTAAWWKHYHQPVLDKLIGQALANHPSLKMAQARVRQADARAQLTGARDGPTIDFNANVTNRHLTAYGQVSPPLAGTISSLYETGLNFNYLFDIWGRTRAQIAAAVNEKEALHIEAQEAARVLALSVSSRYFQYQTLLTDITLLKELIQARQAMEGILKAQYQAGIIRKDQLDWVNAQLQNDQQSLIEAKAQAEKTRHALGALLGASAAQLPAILPIPLPSPQLTDLAALNTDMLAQRADVRAARWRVESHFYSIQAAKAAFYPTISLSAFAGFNALHRVDWFRAGAHQTSITPALNLPLFHAGELRANLRGETAQYDEAVENYNQVLLNALQEAADKLTDLQSAEQKMVHETQAIMAVRSAETLSADRYKVGILSLFNYLETKIKLFQAERQFSAAKHQQLQSELAMIQAMGLSDVPPLHHNISVETQ